MRKRVLSLLLAVLMIISVLPVAANAYTQGYDGLGPRAIQGGQRDFKWPVPGYYNIQSCFLISETIVRLTLLLRRVQKL